MRSVRWLCAIEHELKIFTVVQAVRPRRIRMELGSEIREISSAHPPKQNMAPLTILGDGRESARAVANRMIAGDWKGSRVEKVDHEGDRSSSLSILDD
jgi:hypothetical protein